MGLLKAAAVAKHHETKKEAKEEVKKQAAAEQLEFNFKLVLTGLDQLHHCYVYHFSFSCIT